MSRPLVVSAKVTVPRRAPTPAVLTEFTVASAVAAAPCPVAATRKPPATTAKITTACKRIRLPLLFMVSKPQALDLRRECPDQNEASSDHAPAPTLVRKSRLIVIAKSVLASLTMNQKP